MAYTVFEKVWDKTGKPTFAAYEREKDEALSLFHKKIGGDINPELYSAALVKLFDDNGADSRTEKWVAPVAPVTPPETEGE